MFKLLTEEKREAIEHEYILRRGVVALMALSVILGVGVVVLLPSYIGVLARLNEVHLRINALKNSPMQDDSTALQAWLQDVKAKMGLIASPTISKPYEFFMTALSAKDGTIRITGLSFKTDTKATTTTSTITLNGIAKDRKSLVDFENRINALGSFSTVSLPVSNFAKDKNIQFEISMSPTS